MKYPFGELDKLQRYLIDTGIPFIRRKKEFKSIPFSYWEQICYIIDGKILSDAIVSSNEENNLLAQCGLCWKDGKPVVIHNLRAEDVFNSWEKDWRNRTEKQ